MRKYLEFARMPFLASDQHPYAATSAMIAVITSFGFAAGRLVQASNLDVLFLLAVFISALRWGRRPALFGAVSAAIIFDFCFIPPSFTFHKSDLPYLITLVGFIIVAGVTSEVAARARDARLAERGRADAEAARLRAELARADLETANHAKDILLNRVAHELRAPLTAVLGRVQLLQKTVHDPAATIPLSKLERSTHTLARLIGDLLDTSRMRGGAFHVRLRVTSPQESVARALEELDLLAAQKGVALLPELDSVADIRADPERLQQIVMNLVTNAIKFTPAGGQVTIHLSNAKTGVELTVADTGEGIPPQFVGHIFDPFSQADSENKAGGLGLGLAIVKHLVDAHGARISVRSTLGNGTTFTILFPYCSSDARPLMPQTSRQTDVIH